MSSLSKIEWTDASWSPIRARVKADAGAIAAAKGYQSLVQIATKMQGRVGQHCEHCSHGCDHCWSETDNHRCLPSHGTGLPFDRRARDLTDTFLDEKMLLAPMKWRKPKKIFVEDQSDLFGEWVPDEMIDRVFAVMALCPQHTFQVLTKRAERMREWFTKEQPLSSREEFVAAQAAHTGKIVWDARGSERVNYFGCGSIGDISNRRPWPGWPLPNVWLGVSIESRPYKHRMQELAETPAAVRFLSLEPLLEDLGELDLSEIDWVIVGGESGPGARPMHPDWVRNIQRECAAEGAAFFFKQWGQFHQAKVGPEGELPLTKAQKRRGITRAVTVTYELPEYCAGKWGRVAHIGKDAFISVGKKKAGRILDGRTWDEMPRTAPAESPDRDSKPVRQLKV